MGFIKIRKARKESIVVREGRKLAEFKRGRRNGKKDGRNERQRMEGYKNSSLFTS